MEFALNIQHPLFDAASGRSGNPMDPALRSRKLRKLNRTRCAKTALDETQP
jgi:hypothetical protein